MRLGKKLITSLNQFIRIDRFILFELCVIGVVVFGFIQVNNDINDNTINLLSILGICCILILNSIILLELFGKYLFNDRHIYPIQFMFWHVIDMSNKNNNEQLKMVFWCRNNCKKNSWRQTKNNWFLFKKKDDAILFRMSW